MIFRDRSVDTKENRAKAAILIDALPCIRDFKRKKIILCFEASNVLSEEQVREVMRDIALMRTVGMKPIVVHDSKMGHDKYRENKLLAKMIELSGIRAVGISGADKETIEMALDANFTPVITPNDIDTEDTPISPARCCLGIARDIETEKLVFLSDIDGIYDKEGRKIGQIKCSNFKKMRFDSDFLAERARIAVDLLEHGVPRVHFLDARVEHNILLELFSVRGDGTAVLSDITPYYRHEEQSPQADLASPYP